MSPSEKPKMIVMLSRFPFPLEKGDKLRAYHQIRELKETYALTIICITHQPISSESRNEIQQYCEKLHVFSIPKWRSWLGMFISMWGSKPIQVGYFYTLSIQKKINQILEETRPKHIYCQLIRASEYVKNYHSCAKTLDYMDAFSMGIKRRITLQPFYAKWLFIIEAKRLEKYEREIYNYFEVHTIISEQDANHLGASIHQKVYFIPNGVSPYFLDYSQQTKPSFDLVFVGNLNYPPNVEAVKFIINEILPHAKTQGYSWTFLVAGAEPSGELIALINKTHNAVLKANVVDIREAYCEGKVFVAPMKIGTGLQNKLLEAMALGLPCVTTNLANNALKAKNGEEIMLANTAEEFVTNIAKIIDQPMGDQLATNCQLFVRAHFDWKQSTLELRDLMEKA